MALSTAPVATPTDMSAQERRHLGALERRISAGLQTFREVGNALLEIRDARLYRESHGTFEQYCAERWGMNRARAYQLMDSARVVAVLGDPEDLRNEGQARELAPLNREDAVKVWTMVEARAEQTGKPVTATLIRQVKGEVIEPGGGNGVTRSATDALIGEVSRLGATYQKWKLTKVTAADRRRAEAAIRALVKLIT
jgi:hypothetical protein